MKQPKITCISGENESSAGVREILQTAMEAGHILLENGAEISRVEDTMTRIANHFGVKQCHFFVLSNGIFTTGEEDRDGGESYSRVQHIPVKGASLDRVVAVNQLSRDLDSQELTPQSVRERLQRIRSSEGKKQWQQVLASGLGSCSFCYLFGGGWTDCIGAFIAGLILYLFLLYPGRRLSRIFQNVLGGALITLICFLAWLLHPAGSWSNMIIGAIIPLIPGVPFTNGIRDIADGDYISGAVRLLDACLTFLCIAIGVGCMFSFLQGISGQTGILRPAEVLFSVPGLAIQTAAAFIGTIAFALLYNVPVRYYVWCGLAGSIGWLSYSLLLAAAGLSSAVATFLATCAVVFLCRWLAVWKNCPATVFIVTGIFPLVPGAGIFWTSCYLVTGLLHDAMVSGFQSVKCAIAIVLAIVAVFDIPYAFFRSMHQH